MLVKKSRESGPLSLCPKQSYFVLVPSELIEPNSNVKDKYNLFNLFKEVNYFQRSKEQAIKLIFDTLFYVCSWNVPAEGSGYESEKWVIEKMNLR